MKKLSNKTILNRLKRRLDCCPHCGCIHTEINRGYVEYPEVWAWESCCNCGLTVAYEDNSPWTHFYDEVDYARSLGHKVRTLKEYRSLFYDFYNNRELIKQFEIDTK